MSLKLNTVSWLLWTVAALGAALVERNPFSQVLLLVIVLGTWVIVRGQARWWRFGLPLAIIPVLFDLVSSRFGTHVIFQAPIPLIGGPYTLEALIYGAVSGLAILLTVAIFAVLQASVKTHDVLALLPQSFYRLGALVALALALVPQATATFQRAREARAPADAKGWQRATSLVLPVLLTSLERSLQYAEALDARGFGSRNRTRFRPFTWTVQDLAVVACSIVALMAVALLMPPTYEPYLDLLPPIPSLYSLAGVLCLAVPAAMATMRPGLVARAA